MSMGRSTSSASTRTYKAHRHRVTVPKGASATDEGSGRSTTPRPFLSPLFTQQRRSMEFSGVQISNWFWGASSMKMELHGERRSELWRVRNRPRPGIPALGLKVKTAEEQRVYRGSDKEEDRP